ncbi:MAG: hypothetical protein KDC67_15720, partial [Ignavibacteriae bacterium]|nr:hypothetical protein [Ignavibacteriota bacterium]
VDLVNSKGINVFLIIMIFYELIIIIKFIAIINDVKLGVNVFYAADVIQIFIAISLIIIIRNRADIPLRK